MEGPPESQEEPPEIELTDEDVSFLLQIVDKSEFVRQFSGEEEEEEEKTEKERIAEFPRNVIPPKIICYLKSEEIQQSIMTLCHAATKPALVPKAAEAAEKAEAEERGAQEYRRHILEIHKAGYENETLPSAYPPTLNQDIVDELLQERESTKKAAEAAVKEADERRREAKEATGELEKRFNNFRNGLVKFDDTTLEAIRQLGISPSPLAALLQVCEFLMMDDDVMMDLLYRFVASLVSIKPKTLSEDIFMVAQPDELQEAIQKYQILKDYNEDLTGGDTDLEGRLAQVIDPGGVGAKEYARKVQEAEAEAAKAAAEAAPEATETRQSAQEESAGGNTGVPQLGRMGQLSDLDLKDPNYQKDKDLYLKDLRRAGVTEGRSIIAEEAAKYRRQAPEAAAEAAPEAAAEVRRQAEAKAIRQAEAEAIRQAEAKAKREVASRRQAQAEAIRQAEAEAAPEAAAEAAAEEEA